jgi:molybdopterin-guanine dinucleotide biosynthesis protein A
LTAIADEAPASGPLVAMATGWKALLELGHSGAVIVLACDLPEITVPFLDFIARVPGEGTVVPVVNGRAQPLCARFGAMSLETCRELVAAGRRSLNALLDATPVTWLEQEEWSAIADERCFADIDTPEDLAHVAGFERSRFETQNQSPTR